MSSAGTKRLKVNDPLGSLPVLQYCSPEQLKVDPAYQRTLETSQSQTLVRRIAMYWDWGLCQPLMVARRADGGLYVVDGQHRLAAAQLRGDIWQLPCVVASFRNAAEEAASFVAINQSRRPLGVLDIFKASVLAGDIDAIAIVSALESAGLTVASGSNNQSMKPNAVANVGGLHTCLRVHGPVVLGAALDVLAQSYKDQNLRYAGSIFPGIVAIVAAELKKNPEWPDSEGFALMTAMIGGAEQSDWFKDIAVAIAEDQNRSRKSASIHVFETAWADCCAEQLDAAA